MPGRPVKRSKQALMHEHIVRQYGMTGAARVNGLLQHKSASLALTNAGRKGRDEDEESTAEKIHRHNLHVDLLCFGRDFAARIEQQFRGNPELAGKVYTILEQLNAADAAEFQNGQITILDLLFSPESPYKIA